MPLSAGDDFTLGGGGAALSRGRIPPMGVVVLPGDAEGTLEPHSASDEVSEPDEVFHVVFGGLPRNGSAQELGLHTELGVASEDAVAITAAAIDPAHVEIDEPRVAPAGKVADHTLNLTENPASGGVAVVSETDMTVTVAQTRILRSRWAMNGVVRATVRAVSVTQTAAIPAGESGHLPRAPMAVDSDGVPGSVWLSAVSVPGSGPVSAHPLEQLRAVYTHVTPAEEPGRLCCSALGRPHAVRSDRAVGWTPA